MWMVGVQRDGRQAQVFRGDAAPHEMQAGVGVVVEDAVGC